MKKDKLPSVLGHRGVTDVTISDLSKPALDVWLRELPALLPKVFITTMCNG